MHFPELLNEYFRGEKHLGFALAAVGVGLVAFALWVWRTQTGSFALALWVPLAIVGLGLGVGGVTLASKSDRQVAELTTQFRTDPTAMAQSELPRMAKVNANWPRLKLTWTVLAVVALLLLMVARRPWADGLGLALLTTTTLLFFVDVFAERRAEKYTAALHRLGSPPAPVP